VGFFHRQAGCSTMLILLAILTLIYYFNPAKSDKLTKIIDEASFLLSKFFKSVPESA
jgi:hypothetical protein